MEPPFYYVRDSVSKAAHHWDYFHDRHSHGLCGHAFEGSIAYEGPKRPSKVCRRCQDALPAYEARWWRETAETAAHEQENLAARLEKAERQAEVLRVQAEQQIQAIAAYLKQHAPPVYFVRDSASTVAHHWDYISDRSTEALCGYEFENSIAYEGTTLPARVCSTCEAILPQYEARWWRDVAGGAELLRRKFQQRADRTKNELTQLQKHFDLQAERLRGALVELGHLKRQGGRVTDPSRPSTQK